MPTQKILYVEDHPESQQAISDLLPVVFDCTVDIAIDGLSGVEKAKNGAYSVIIMDVGLPDIDGIEAARRIKQANPKPVIVSSSAHALSDEISTDIFAANFQKPLGHQLKEFGKFCNAVGIELTELE